MKDIPFSIIPEMNNSFENIRIKLNDDTKMFSVHSPDNFRYNYLSSFLTKNKTIVMGDDINTFWNNRYNDPSGQERRKVCTEC